MHEMRTAGKPAEHFARRFHVRRFPQCCSLQFNQGVTAEYYRVRFCFGYGMGLDLSKVTGQVLWITTWNQFFVADGATDFERYSQQAQQGLATRRC